MCDTELYNLIVLYTTKVVLNLVAYLLIGDRVNGRVRSELSFQTFGQKFGFIIWLGKGLSKVPVMAGSGDRAYSCR